MIYIVDIDNTICHTIDGDYSTSRPYTTHIEKINKLYDSGNTIIYWTARGMQSGKNYAELTEKQLKSWGCKYHDLRMHKPSYDVWIDDKAINALDFFV
jgi:hypothetical protein